MGRANQGEGHLLGGPARWGGLGRLRMALMDKMQGTKHSIAYFALLFEQGKFQVTRAI